MYGMIVMMGMCEAPVPWFDVTLMAKTKYSETCIKWTPY